MNGPEQQQVEVGWPDEVGLETTLGRVSGPAFIYRSAERAGEGAPYYAGQQIARYHSEEKVHALVSALERIRSLTVDQGDTVEAAVEASQISMDALADFKKETPR